PYLPSPASSVPSSFSSASSASSRGSRRTSTRSCSPGTTPRLHCSDSSRCPCSTMSSTCSSASSGCSDSGRVGSPRPTSSSAASSTPCCGSTDSSCRWSRWATSSRSTPPTLGCTSSSPSPWSRPASSSAASRGPDRSPRLPQPDTVSHETTLERRDHCAAPRPQPKQGWGPEATARAQWPRHSAVVSRWTSGADESDDAADHRCQECCGGDRQQPHAEHRQEVAGPGMALATGVLGAEDRGTQNEGQRHRHPHDQRCDVHEDRGGPIGDCGLERVESDHPHG